MVKGSHAALKVVENMDNTIHWINLYPVDNEISFPNTNLSDSDSSSGWCYLSFEELESGSRRYMFTMEEALEDQHWLHQSVLSQDQQGKISLSHLTTPEHDC